MKQLFVPYDIALLARQSGFNDECFAAYHKNKLDSNEFKIDKAFYKNDDFSDLIVTAPIYQQLIDWFRNDHQIEITIMPVFREKCGYDSFKRDGYTYDIMQIQPCQYLTWADFNRCAENIDQEMKENDNIKEYCILKPSLPDYYDVVNIAIKQAFKLLKNEK